MALTHRQRMQKAYVFDCPDKLPVFYHASPAGLYVQSQTLIDLFNAHPGDNEAIFDKIPFDIEIGNDAPYENARGLVESVLNTPNELWTQE